jgi:hypothetical protein
VGSFIDYTKNCSAGAYKIGGVAPRPGDGWIATARRHPGTATVSPSQGRSGTPAKIMQTTWTSLLSNRLLFESGYSASIPTTAILGPSRAD